MTSQPRRGDSGPPVCYKYPSVSRGYSSVGRAARSHRAGQGFESPYLHLSPAPGTDLGVGHPGGFWRRTKDDQHGLGRAPRIHQQARDPGRHHRTGAGGRWRRPRPATTAWSSVFVPHTTAGVTINEGADPSVARDIVDGPGPPRAREAGYDTPRATPTRTSRPASWAATWPCRSSAAGLRLGTWQSIYLAEFDGPRTRRVWIILRGVTAG